MSHPQLPLALRLPVARRFDTFVGAGNEAALAEVHLAAAGGRDGVVYLSGAEGVGKTHLLLAACAEAQRLGRRAQYVSLASWRALDGDAVAALAALDLVCVDDLDAAIGESEAEVGLFALANACRDAHLPLLIAARVALPDLPAGLPDLRSRLAQGLRLKLAALPERARRQAVRLRADQLGLSMDEAAIEFLFRRFPRDLTALMTLIERLDRESLAAKRRITVPFLRQALGL
ncbi:MAG TPA: DnaA regulatory inactivator Hda [Xanthomonadaceae bacterium]|nr:DnaA regulatory inactivator Hda [Xanthomonadaceae bacterium]